MITNIDNYLVGIVIGIRYRANFSIEDSLGAIVDKVLYDKKAFFNPNIFPLVQNTGNGKLLFNDKNSDRLTINNSNIVLDLLFDGYFPKEDCELVINKFNEQIIEGIMKQYKITEIIRIGIVKRYLFQLEDLAESFINKTIGNTLDGISDINLRFSKKIPTSEAMVHREVLDYSNVIFNIIKQSDKNELFVSMDYQKYFDPFLSSVNELKYDDFIKTMSSFNKNNYLSWLNKNYLNE